MGCIRMVNLRKGISPVIATVIIVAVAVAIAIAVVGWIMGLWGSVAGGTESIKIYPDSYLEADTTNDQTIVHLHIKNEGSAAAVIYKVEVSGIGSASNTTTVAPAQDITLNLTIKKACTAGGYYLVKVYTKAGNVYQANVICKTYEKKQK